MRRAATSLALVAALAVAGCGSEPDAPTEQASGRYSADVRTNFLDSCVRNATNSATGEVDEQQLTSTCECILEKVEAQYSEAEFAQFEQRLLGGTASDADSQQLVAWSNDCAQS